MKTIWYWLTDKSDNPIWLFWVTIAIVIGFVAVALSGEPLSPRIGGAVALFLLLMNSLWFVWNWVSHRKAMRRSARRDKPFSTRMLSDPTLLTLGANLLPRFGDEEQVASGRESSSD